MTIADIARRAEVSKGAVSYALNGRPGLSDATRERILSIAKELGWYPNSAARALSAARAGACGLVLARPVRTLALEPFFMELIAGIEGELASRSFALTLQLVDTVDAEIEVYRRWWAEHRVDGVLVVDPRLDDPRISEVVQLGLPAVLLGGPLEIPGVPSIWHDEQTVIAEVVRYLAALGHRRIARIAGLQELLHTSRRTEAYRRTLQDLDLPALLVHTDYMAESGAQATRQLLSDPLPPSAIIYDSDLLAVAGLGVAHEMGLRVPDELSVVAWEDSLLTQVVHPPLTAVHRDVPAYGAAAARRLLACVEDGTVGDEETPRGVLLPRGSTGRLPPSSPPAPLRSVELAANLPAKRPRRRSS